MWRQYNPNPRGRMVGDCTIRALAKATGESWYDVYTGVSLDGYQLADMMSANHVWGAYLRRSGWRRHLIPDDAPDDYTVSDFAEDHPSGTYILALDGHVVTIVDGDWYDTWDSGNEIVNLYWTKEN